MSGDLKFERGRKSPKKQAKGENGQEEEKWVLGAHSFPGVPTDQSINVKFERGRGRGSLKR